MSLFRTSQVYGSAHYTALLPDNSENKTRDVLVALAKGRNRDVWKTIGTSTLEGWHPSNGVEMSFNFLNTCSSVVAWLSALTEIVRAKQMHEPRRVVVVTNIGASNIKATLDHLWCLAEELPAVVTRVSGAWTLPSWAPHHHLVVMNQPMEKSILGGRTSPFTVAAANEAVNRALNLLNNGVGDDTDAIIDNNNDEHSRSSHASPSIPNNAAWLERVEIERAVTKPLVHAAQGVQHTQLSQGALSEASPQLIAQVLHTPISPITYTPT
jgi:hypothetical protein